MYFIWDFEHYKKENLNLGLGKLDDNWLIILSLFNWPVMLIFNSSFDIFSTLKIDVIEYLFVFVKF